MQRRKVLALGGIALTTTLAGCGGTDDDATPTPETDDDGPTPVPDEAFDISEDMPTVEAWVDDAIDYIEDTQLRLGGWVDDPDSFDTETFATERDRGEVLADERWFNEIEPLMDEIETTAIERTVGEDTWTIDGEDLYETLDELWWAADAAWVSYENALDADGDPDALSDADVSVLEDVFEDGDDAVADGRAIFYEGGL